MPYYLDENKRPYYPFREGQCSHPLMHEWDCGCSFRCMGGACKYNYECYGCGAKWVQRPKKIPLEKWNGEGFYIEKYSPHKKT